MIDAFINWVGSSSKQQPKPARETFCEILHIVAPDPAITPNITEATIGDALIPYKTDYAELIYMRDKLQVLQKQCLDNVFNLDTRFIEDSEQGADAICNDEPAPPAQNVDLNIVFLCHNTRTLINRLLVNIENNDALLQ
jgi:hypothetical protein